MDYLLQCEKHAQGRRLELLQESSSFEIMPLPDDLKSDSPEEELWSRVHLCLYAKPGGFNAASINKWVSARIRCLIEYVPSHIWHLSQEEVTRLKQSLLLRMQSSQYYDENYQFNENGTSVVPVLAPIRLFCQAFLCFACKDKELFDETLLDVDWSEFLYKNYAPIWRAGIEFLCTKVTDDNLLSMALCTLATVNVVHKCLLNLLGPTEKASLSWLYEPLELRTIVSLCEGAVSAYFDGSLKLQFCEDVTNLSSAKRNETTVHQVDDIAFGAKVVIQSCWRLCGDMDYVILILEGQCALYEKLKSLCADALGCAITVFLQELSMWCTEDAGQRMPYHSWYILLSSLLYVAGRLRHHVTHSTAGFLAVPLQQCSKLVDRVQSDIVNYHVGLYRNGLLHDGRSHHWQDSRPFYEGERCSFAVQMWAYHLKAFKHDLWQVFAHDVAAKLLGAVLAEGLVILSQRYGCVKPSMRRQPQMKADILVLLLTSASFLSQLFPVQCLHTHPLHVTSCVINSCCMSLLRNLTLVCADLRAIADHVMQHELTSNESIKSFSDCNFDWLHNMLHLNIDLPLTYVMGDSSNVETANSLLHLCGLSTMNEQLLIKVLLTNNFLCSKGLIVGGANVVSELTHILCRCSHTPSALCTVLEQAGSHASTDWLTSFLQPHLQWCLLPGAALFTRWLAKSLCNEASTSDDDDSRKTLVELFSEVLEKVYQLLLLLPASVCLLISVMSPVSVLLARLLRSMFPQSHNQLFYNFISVVAGILDGSMLFADDIPDSVVDLLVLCKNDFTSILATLNDTSVVTNDIANGGLCDDSEHGIVAKLLMKTCRGRSCLGYLYNTIILNQDELLRWCKNGDMASKLQPLSASPSYVPTDKPFCPLKEFCQIGQALLDHRRLLKASPDWPGLLNVICLSEDVLADRIGNRWEFQQEAWLTDEESQLVDIIRKRLAKQHK